MVAVKDMEMPSCCLWDCPLAREDGGACQLADVRTSDKERPIDCPLIEIVTCKDCKYNVKSGKNTTMCDLGHRFYMRDHSTFYCADAERRE